MGLKISNLATSVVVDSTLPSDETSINVEDGSVFPAISLDDGDYFNILLKYSDDATVAEDDKTNAELCKVTSVSNETLTVERGAEGTIPLLWESIGDDDIKQVIVAHVVTANDMLILTGIVNKEYEGADGGKLGTADSKIDEVNSKNLITDNLTVDGVELSKASGTGTPGEIKIPIVDADDSEVDRTLVTEGNSRKNTVPYIGGVIFYELPEVVTTPIKIIGGKYGDYVGMVQFGNIIILHTVFEELLDATDSDSIFLGLKVHER